MLKHEDIPQPQTPSPSAAQVRVTPEELAAAVTALQIRKEGQPGTIAIGDAVDELGLDVTPEEVLAEVQARRQVRKPKRRRDYWAFACAVVCAVPLAFGTFYRLPVHSNAPARPALPVAQAETLSGVGDEQQVYVDVHGLQQLLSGAEPSQIQVYSDYKTLRWGLIKHSGESYVQGYTAQTGAELASQPITLGNCVDHYGPNRIGFNVEGQFYPVLKVTLPVKGLYHPDFMQTPQEVLVGTSGVRSDRHLRDSFPDHFIQ